MLGGVILAVALIAPMLVLVIWLRVRPDHAKAIEQKLEPINAIGNMNPVREEAILSLVYGFLSWLLANYVRVSGQSHNAPTFVKLAEPTFELNLIATYLIGCGVIFLIRPWRFGQLLMAIGFGLLGVWTIYAGLAAFAGAQLRSLHGDVVDSLATKYPIFVVILGALTIRSAYKSGAEYFREVLGRRKLGKFVDELIRNHARQTD